MMRLGVIYSKMDKGMKWLTLYVLIVTLVSACRDDGLAPNQKRQLYKTWLRTQSLRDGRDVTPDKAYAFRVEFVKDGRLLYGTQKAPGGCCSPSFFAIESESIIFRIDAADPNLFCANSVCNASELWTSVRWRIKTVSTSKLVLENEQTMLLFEPAP
jgi:hypothetical protein